MPSKKVKNTQKAQTLMEYTLVLGVIAVILFAMNPFLKRTTQGMIKFVADQVGNQKNSDQAFDNSGHLENSYTRTSSFGLKQTRENVGITGYSYNDTTRTNTTTSLNLGFTQRIN